MQIQHVRSISIRRIVHSTGLAALVSTVAIGTALFATRYTSAPAAHIPAVQPAQSVALGIPRPAGVDMRELPRGYSDYFLPESSDAVAKPSSVQLGITRPIGVDLRTLPRGYSDYFLPQDENSAAQSVSTRLGIARPASVDVRMLPRGYSDYFLPND
jgi:hypothetical protein